MTELARPLKVRLDPLAPGAEGLRGALRAAGHELVDDEQADVVVGDGGEARLVLRGALSTKESELLAELLAHSGQVLTREELLVKVWGHGSLSLSRTLDTTVARLRKKIEPDPAFPRFLLTVHGTGYRFELPLRRGRIAEAPSITGSPGGRPREDRSQGGSEEVSERITNLPPETTRFFGRTAEQGEIGRWLDEGAGLVTLRGPAGAGKTRLLRRIGASRSAPGGVWFVEMAECRTADAVVDAAARALGVPLVAGRDGAAPLAQLGAALAARPPALLLLDNAEQAAQAVATVVQALRAASPEGAVVVTSREALRLGEERIFEVEPLPESDAVALFVERARAVAPGFEPNEGDLGPLRELIGRLDGLPLAIELAASRAGVLSPSELLDRLGGRLQALGRVRRDAVARQATLRGALDWQWGLLGAPEQRAFMAASVFRGGFSAAAFEALVGPELGDLDALDVLQGLVDQSLVRSWRPVEAAGASRFGMYEFVRTWGGELLDEAGGRPEIEARHAEVVLARAEALAAGMDGAGGVGAIRALTLESDNLLAVHRRGVGRAKGGDPQGAEVAARAALCLDPLLYLRGPSTLQRSLLDETLAVLGPEAHPGRRARLLRGRADLHRREGRMAEAGADLDAALALPGVDEGRRDEVIITRGLWLLETGRSPEAILAFEGVMERAKARRATATLGQATFYRGIVEEWRGNMPLAEELLLVARRLLTQVEDRARIGVVEMDLGTVYLATGREAQAIAAFEAALEICREIGSPRREAIVLVNLATARFGAGRLDEARGRYEEALALHRRVGNLREAAIAVGNLGWLAAEAGQTDEAEGLLREALDQHRILGNRRSEAVAIGNLGLCAQDRGDLTGARAALVQATALLKEVGDPRAGAYFSGWLGAVCGELGDLVGAGAALSDARERIGSVPNLYVQAVIDGIAAVFGDGVAPEARSAAWERLEGLAGRSAEVRRARRWLGARL